MDFLFLVVTSAIQLKNFPPSPKHVVGMYVFAYSRDTANQEIMQSSGRGFSRREMEKNLFAHYMHRCCSAPFFPCLSIQRRTEQIRLITLLYYCPEYNPHCAQYTHQSHLNYRYYFALCFHYLFTFVNIFGLIWQCWQ